MRSVLLLVGSRYKVSVADTFGRWSVQEAFFYCLEFLGAGGTPNSQIVATCSTFLSGFVFSHWLWDT